MFSSTKNPSLYKINLLIIIIIKKKQRKPSFLFQCKTPEYSIFFNALKLHNSGCKSGKDCKKTFNFRGKEKNCALIKRKQNQVRYKLKSIY